MELKILYFMMVLSYLIYWCVNEKTGLQLGIVNLISIWVISVYMQLEINLPYNIGWIIFAVIFCGYLLLRNKIETLLSLGGFRAYVLTTAVISFLLILYRPNYEFVIPGGFLLGLGAGYCLNKRFIGFKSADVLQRKGAAKYLTLLARFIIGIAILVFIEYRVVRIIETVAERQNIMLYCFLCYGVISLWVSIAAPWIFIKLRLAGAVFDTKWMKKNDK
ncbi:MAG: hypothetical protein FWB77_01235 [Treponema sp.]|nr:hypothetical protein [Treponema sp.]